MPAAHAQTPLTSTEDLVQAQTLVQRMLEAQKTLVLSGDEVTTLYRPEQTFSASQTIFRKGDQDLRLEYRSPDAIAGEVYVDNGKIAWHYIPSQHRLEVGLSGLGHMRSESNGILKRLNNHQITAEIIGHDVIAGQSAQIVQVSAEQSWGQRRYWIDPVTGAQLKIQTFGAFGQMVSQTYFTRISYDTKLSTSVFDPPKVDPDVATVPMFPPGSQAIAGTPTNVECGFTPMQPAYLPQGFTYQSAMLMPANHQKILELTYENALVVLSIFEQPSPVRVGKPPAPDEFKSPRQGVMTARFNGYKYVVIGTLPEDVMRQIIQSMH